MSTHHPLCPELKYGVNADLDWPSECECDLIERVLAYATENPVTMTVHDSDDEFGLLSVDIPDGVTMTTITTELLRQMVTALNLRAPEIRVAEQRGYTRGYNDRAKVEQRTLIEYGGRPSKPGLCGKPCSYDLGDDKNPCTNQRGHEGPCDCNGVETA